MNVKLPCKIEIEDVAIGKVETWIGEEIPAAQMELMAREMLISREAGR
jgi:hypothetical protein